MQNFEYHYYMFHKPYGCVTARRDDTYPTVMDYFRSLGNPDLSPVGRLDLESEGLLFITDDGKWNGRMTEPSCRKEKIYEFVVMGCLTEAAAKTLEQGIRLPQSDHITAPAKVEITARSTFQRTIADIPPEIAEKLKRNLPDTPTTYGRITITEGKKHQVRKMMKAVGCYVIRLKRISMGGIPLDPTLLPGQWKAFDPFI